jgi:hypothetical protein
MLPDIVVITVPHMVANEALEVWISETSREDHKGTRDLR